MLNDKNCLISDEAKEIGAINCLFRKNDKLIGTEYCWRGISN